MKRTLCYLLIMLFVFYPGNASAFITMDDNITCNNVSPQTETIKQDLPVDGIPVLMYHSISNKPGNIFCVPAQQFLKEMAWLYSHGYNTISMDELCDAINNGSPLKEKPIMISFDDGYEDNYDVAFPILKQFGYTATFFLVSDFVAPGWLTWQELKELSDAGNSIESHTASHRDLRTLTSNEQRKELLKSKQLIESKLGTRVRAISYPFGGYNEKTLSLLQSLGYELAFTSKHGRVYNNDIRFKLKRIGVDGGMPLNKFIKGLS